MRANGEAADAVAAVAVVVAAASAISWRIELARLFVIKFCLLPACSCDLLLTRIAECFKTTEKKNELNGLCAHRTIIGPLEGDAIEKEKKQNNAKQILTATRVKLRKWRDCGGDESFVCIRVYAKKRL